MKKILIFMLTALLTATVSGQTNEFSVQLSSGLFSFGGLSATKTSTIIFTQNSYTNNPYGRGSGFSYGFGPVSYTHLRAHETVLDLVCRLLLEKKTKNT